MTMTDLPILKPNHFEFANATRVISEAQKFVIPVPRFADGGEPLVFPADHPGAGQRITDWQGNAIGDEGVVFWNFADLSWQAAPGDGRAIMIMNQVSGSQVEGLFEHFVSLGDPKRIGLAEFKGFLTFACKTMGVTDLYNSDRAFVAEHMTPVHPERFTFDADGEIFGYLKRDARDIALAVFIDEPFLFEMAGADRPIQQMGQGGVVVAIPNAKGEPSIHAVQPAAFVSTYRLAEGGRPITELSRQILKVPLSTLLESESTCA